MKKFRRITSLLLSAVMIMTGCLFSMPVAFATDTSEGPVLQDYSVQITNTDPKTEEGEEFIVSLKFDQELTTDRYTSNAFTVMVNGRTPADMGFRNPIVSVSEEDSKTLILDFKGVENSTWTYLVSRTLSITLKSNYYEDIMNKDGVGVPADGWTDINTLIPAIAGATGPNDVFEKVSYTPGSAADGVKESVTFKMIGDAKARAANTVQIMNGDNIDTDNTIIPNSATASVVVHTHMFKTMTNADIVATIASNFNKTSTDYEMITNLDTETPTNSTMTITAKEASDQQGLDKATMNLIAYSTPNDRIVQQTSLKTELASAKQRLQNIEDDKVAAAEKEALAEAIETTEASYQKVDENTTAIEFNKIRNVLRNAVNAAADNAISTDSATRDGIVTLKLTGGKEWTDSINGVVIDEETIDSDLYTVKNGSISINSLAFEDPQRTKTYSVTLKSETFADVTKDIVINFYGAQTFQIRYVDGDGYILKAKTYTMDQMKALSDQSDYYYHAICTMRGLTAFKGEGVMLTDILKDAGIEFSEGMTAQLRTNDSVEESEENDPTDEDAYYWRGNFDYNYLMQDRYYFPDLYDEDSDLAKAAAAASGRVTFNKGDAIRAAAGASENKVLVEPMIAYSFAESSWSTRNPYSLEETEYDEAECMDNCFRFLFGTALDTEDGVTVSKAETTLWSLSYQTFGVDIIDSSYHQILFDDSSLTNGTVELDAEGAYTGDTVSFTAVPDDGYTAEVSVETEDGDTVEVTESEDGYSFEMPDAAVEVFVSFVERDYYEIIFDDSSLTNGTVELDAESAYVGDTVYFTAVPDDGYTAEVSVETVDGDTVEVTESEDGYSFEMPDTAVKISVSFVEVPAPEPVTYNVAVTNASTDMGTVSTDVSSAEEGATVTVTVTAKEGYEIKGVTVSGGVEVSGSEGTYTFVMPAADVTVTAEYEEVNPPVDPEPADFPFEDVTADRWSRDAVEYVFNKKLFIGVSDTLFAPELNMSRAMMVTVLYRLDGSPAVSGTSSFTDLTAGEYYVDAVNWAAGNKIVMGTGDNLFDPDADITREQLITIMYRYAEYKNADLTAGGTLDKYTDKTSISSYAEKAFTWAVSNGLVNGMTETTLEPQGTATREQVAAVIKRFAEKYVK